MSSAVRMEMGELIDRESDFAIGETRRFNHTRCEAGEDKRQRLYMTRPANTPNILLGYCHNCQDKGVVTIGSERFRDSDTNTVPPVVCNDVVTQPDSVIFDTNEWPGVATAWRYKNNLNIAMTNNAGIGYDSETSRIYLPMFNSILLSRKPNSYTHGRLVGFQLRNLSNHGVKYYKSLTPGQPHSTIISAVGEPNDSTTVAVVVEDYISGLIMAEAMMQTGYGFKILVNYGTQVDAGALCRLGAYDHAVVWLDNDNKHVREQAQNMSRTLQLLNPVSTNVVMLEKDPKNCADKTIRSEVLKWIQ